LENYIPRNLGKQSIASEIKKSDSLQVNPWKKGRRCVKLWKNKVKLVLREEIKMHQVVEVVNQDLKGCFFNNKSSEKKLWEWLELEWKP
jgi:hypothetical protein